MAGVVLREVLGLPDVAAITLLDQRTGQALGVGGLGVGQFGDAEEVEELVVGERGGGFGRPLAFLQCPEGGGGETGEALPEWKLAVHPVEALGVGRVVPDDPVEVVGVEPVEVGTEGVDLDPQPQSVGLGDGPPMLPFLRGEFGVEVLEFEPSGAKRRWMKVRQAVCIATSDRIMLVARS